MINWVSGEKITYEFTAVADGKKHRNEWEVVSKGRIKVIECDPHFGSYLNVGQEYDLVPHKPSSYLELWEIPVENTKRPDSSSQVLLYDWNDGPNAKPSMEIDF